MVEPLWEQHKDKDGVMFVRKVSKGKVKDKFAVILTVQEPKTNYIVYYIADMERNPITNPISEELYTITKLNKRLSQLKGNIVRFGWWQ